MNQEIEKIVKALKELDLKNYPYDTIVDLINSVTVGIPIMTVTIPKGKRLVRTRVNGKISRFNKREELSFVPLDKKSGFFARASTPNNTMFYATTSAPDKHCTINEVETTFYETLEFLNDKDAICCAKITYGNWFPKEDLNLLAIIPYVQKYEGRDFVSEMKSYYSNKLEVTDPEYKSKTSMDFIELMSSEFSKKVTLEHEYMISAIFTEIVLKNNSIDGIFYPSIKNDEICYNVALIPESIKKLSLLVVMECSVYKNKDIIEFCEDAIAPVNEFGEILWNES